MEIFTYPGFMALLQVIGIDLVLAGDNAIVIGLAAAGLPKEQRGRAILVGVAAATVLRIGFALITTWLLGVVGLLLAGGLLLLWVCWKMWRELRASSAEEHQHAVRALSGNGNGTAGSAPRKTFGQAALQIVIADVSMSLDNVLAVAGAAREHPTVLVLGLALSVALMGLAASYLARVLHRYPMIAYAGLLIILYVALSMIWEGSQQVLHGSTDLPEGTIEQPLDTTMTGAGATDTGATGAGDQPATGSEPATEPATEPAGDQGGG